mgnify:CR=1 FL=1
MTYQVTRAEVVEAALSLQGVRFRHQGRDAATGIDCVGLLVVVGDIISYPQIFDVEAYRRVPSASVIRETLEKNCDEIPLSEVRQGDIYLMRIGGRKPRHAAIRISDEIDVQQGKEPLLIHANGAKGNVLIEPVSYWEKGFVTGFRIRGLV